MRMQQFVFLLVFVIIGFIGPDLWGDENSCVSCHSKLSMDTFVGSNYLDWKNSVHQEHDITCDMCHGGSPEEKEKGAAHKGVYKSGDPRSTVYFQNVPATCGECHKEIYIEFIQSNHYRTLEKTGVGPTCGTCHGSRATWIVAPRNLKAICVNCHNERKGIVIGAPDEARALLLALNQSVSIHELLCKFTQKGDDEKVKQLLNTARINIDRSKIVWHSFDLEAVSQLLLEANEALIEVEREIK